MKKTLTVSLKNSEDFFSGVNSAFKSVAKKRVEGSHYEVSFDDKKSFDRFVKNIGLLSLITNLKPKSVYELAKQTKMDVSNLNKIILFFEEIGVVKIKRKKVQGRTVAQPIVEYEKIEFNLAA